MRNASVRASRLLLSATIAGAMMVGMAVPNALAQDSSGPGVAVTVRGTVDETLDALKKMVGDAGMMVMGEIHQGKMLEMTGLKAESETIFVGNPKVGKDILSAEPGAGIAVPIRINVYKGANGDTVVRYVPPSELLRGFSSAKVLMIGKMLDVKLANLTKMLPRL